jgi:hypothetical protein
VQSVHTVTVLRGEMSSEKPKQHDKIVKKREWDAKYAREKRQREKEERATLQKQYQNLLITKTRLETENKMLTANVRLSTETFYQHANQAQVCAMESSLAQVRARAIALGLPPALTSTSQAHSDATHIQSATPTVDMTVDAKAQMLVLLQQLAANQPLQQQQQTAQPLSMSTTFAQPESTVRAPVPPNHNNNTALLELLQAMQPPVTAPQPVHPVAIPASNNNYTSESSAQPSQDTVQLDPAQLINMLNEMVAKNTK